jgi:hypothetical protein
VHGDPTNLVDPSGLLGVGTTGTTISVATSIGISIASTAWLVNTASNLIGNIVQGAALRAKAAELGVEYVSDVRIAQSRRDQSKRHFVHGTTTNAWQGLANNIQIFTDGRPLDFGYGFYTRLFTIQGFGGQTQYSYLRMCPQAVRAEYPSCWFSR